MIDLAAVLDERQRGRRRGPIPLPVRGPTLTQQDDLAKLILPVVRHWEERLPRLAAVAAREYVADAAEDIEAEVEGAHLAGVGLTAAAAVALYAWALRLDRWHRARWVATIRARTGIEIDNMLPDVADREALRRAVSWAATLIRDVNDELRRKIMAALMTSAEMDAGPEALTRRLREITGKSRTRAQFIARDQSAKIAAKMTELRALDAGLKRYAWQHSFRKNPRRHHVERQGNFYEWSRPPRDGHPGHAPNCRCTAAPIIEAG